MANLGNFDATKVEPTSTFDPIPNGDYRVAIIKSELKPTKAKTGHYLEMTAEILDEPHKGRKLFGWRLNLDNPNKVAVDIAERDLSAICHAIGKMSVSDSSDLHDVPFTAKVIVTKDQNGNPRNEIKGPVLGKKKGLAAGTDPSNNGKADSGDSSSPPWKR